MVHEEKACNTEANKKVVYEEKACNTSPNTSPLPQKNSKGKDIEGKGKLKNLVFLEKKSISSPSLINGKAFTPKLEKRLSVNKTAQKGVNTEPFLMKEGIESHPHVEGKKCPPSPPSSLSPSVSPQSSTEKKK